MTQPRTGNRSVNYRLHIDPSDNVMWYDSFIQWSTLGQCGSVAPYDYAPTIKD